MLPAITAARRLQGAVRTLHCRSGLRKVAVRHCEAEGCEILVLGRGSGLDYLMQRTGLLLAAGRPATTSPLAGIGEVAASAMARGALVIGRLHAAELGALDPGSFLVLPELVDGMIAPDPPASYRPPGVSARKSAKKAQNNGLAWRRREDLAAFHRFYDAFYVPSARAKFGKLAQIRPRWRLRLDFMRGFLNEIHDGEAVLGMELVVRERDVLHLIASGVRVDGDARAKGAPAMFYIAAVETLARSGARAINTGGSMPSLTDRVLYNKQDWGAQVVLRPQADHRLVLGWSGEAAARLARRMIAELEPLVFAQGGLVAIRPEGARPLRAFRRAGLAGVLEADHALMAGSRDLAAAALAAPS